MKILINRSHIEARYVTLRILHWFVLLAGFHPLAALAYDPPIGIPDPGDSWQGIHPIDSKAPSRPSDWSGDVPGYYFVEPSSSSATDSSNPYGYPSKPRKTVPELQPGSYVELHGNFDSQITVRAQCTGVEPCWVRGQEASMRPAITASMEVVDSTYVIIEHMQFSGGTGRALGIFGATKNVAVRDIVIKNRAQPKGATSGISILPGLGDLIENIVVYGSQFESLGDWTVLEDLDFHAVNPNLWGRDSNTELRNVWILENFCKLLSGDCVQVNAGNWQDSYKYLHHIYIGRNESTQNRQTGFWVKQASDVIISQNKSHGYDGSGGNAGGAIGYQYPKNNLWIIFNELYDAVYGIRQSDTPDIGIESSIYVIGNLIYNIRPAKGRAYDPTDPWSQGSALALWHGNSDRYIVNNTIHDVFDGIVGIYSGGIEIYGNIISQKDDHPDNHFLGLNQPARNDLVKMDYNLFLDDSTESYFAWWPNVSGRMSSLAQVQEAGHCGFCYSDIGQSSFLHFLRPTSDPLKRDFHLSANSIAVRSGIRHSVYDIFSERYGLNIYVDFDGYPRPADSPSVGAFEFRNEGSPNSPSDMETD